MYNSVIECVKVSNIFIGLKKDLFGLVWKVWLYRRHSKRNQRIKITMTITTVLPYTRLHSLSSHFDFSFFLIFVNTYRLIFNSGLTKISTSALVNILLPLLGDVILRLILIWEMRKMSRTEVNAWRTSLFNWSISLLWLLWLWLLFEEDCFFKN